MTFSDPSLLSIQKVTVDGYTGETSWYLKSLAPFTSEECLTVTFCDGSVITINVYDANYTTLSNNLTLNDGDTISTTTVNGNVTLHLNGTVTVTGIITIPAGASLTITGSGTIRRDAALNLNLFNVEGALNISGSADSAIVIDGGAVWSHTPVANSTRELLTVTKGNNVYDSAIYVKSGTLTLSYVVMQNLFTKTVGTDGGQAPAIQTHNTNASVPPATVTLDHVTVQDCATTRDNAIVNINNSIANFTNCTYQRNYAVSQYSGVVKAGGPEEFCLLTMTNCTATGNYSSGWGGFILWAANGAYGNATSKAVIDNCRFTGNKARWLGGAISNEAIMEISNTTIVNNTAMSGGGIAAFPYTRTEGSLSNNKDCGLHLLDGNTISGNHSVAETSFTPFQSLGQGAADDEKTIDSPITYPGGGGGIWFYMNKPEWSNTMTINSGNAITGNEAFEGGGVYIGKDAGTALELNISGAVISENTATNGGGVYVMNADVVISSGEITANTASRYGGGINLRKGSCTVTGAGAVKNNNAVNGGGISIYEGTINVTGGIISGNRAAGTFTGSTTQVKPVGEELAVQGVGGGIYLRDGTFTLSGENIGIYSNTASVAASDVYAHGQNTTLTLPEVRDMNLTGMAGTRPIGWFVDYKASDTQYPLSVIGSANPGRYQANAENNLEISHTVINSNGTAFYCLTLGTPHPGYGELTINKTVTEAAAKDQTFIFEVTGVTTAPGDNSYRISVSLVIPAGQTSASITIKHICDGIYTVTEKSDWSWRYSLRSYTFYPEGNRTAAANNITISAADANWCADFKNARSKDNWLSGDCYCENRWTDAGVKRRDKED